MSQTLSQLLIKFVENTIAGQESGLYKMISMGAIPLPMEGLKNNNMAGFFSGPVVSYLNQCYKSLILKNDPYVLEKFNEMKAVYNHSEICLLNIIAEIIKTVHKNIDRNNFDISSYENYMETVTTSICSILNELNFEDKLSHTCTGIDISTCDPNKPMFHTIQ